MARQERVPVDIDRLADYIGGALDGADHDEVTRLVADDPQWRETYELLVPGMSAVGDGLHELGAEPMPDDVAARLDDAFSATTSVPVRHLSLVPDEPDADAPRIKKTSKIRRWAAPIAVAAAVLTFAGVGVEFLTGGGSGSSFDSTTSQEAGGAADNAPAPMMEGPGSAELSGEQILSTGTNYTPDLLAAAPANAAGKTFDQQERSAEEPARQSGLLGRLSPRPALQECLDAIRDEHGAGPLTVETVDYALYLGEPSVIVRFAAAGAVWAYAVGPDCGAPGSGADVRNQVQVR